MYILSDNNKKIFTKITYVLAILYKNLLAI